MNLIGFHSKFIDSFPSFLPDMAVIILQGAMVMCDRAVLSRAIPTVEDDGSITVTGWGEIICNNGQSFAILRGSGFEL
jgi:hypothetical protein